MSRPKKKTIMQAIREERRLYAIFQMHTVNQHTVNNLPVWESRTKWLAAKEVVKQLVKA